MISVIAFVITPIVSLGKYYRPRALSVKKNILWVIIALITWPLVPFILAWRHKDILIVSIFSLCFGIWVTTLIYIFTVVMAYLGYDLGAQ